MSQFQICSFRPLSAKYQSPYSDQPTSLPGLFTRPSTAHLQPPIKVNQLVGNLKHLQPSQKKVSYKLSRNQSIFATDLRDSLEENNIRRMNNEVDMFFGRAQVRPNKDSRPVTVTSKKISRGSTFHICPNSAVKSPINNSQPLHITVKVRNPESQKLCKEVTALPEVSTLNLSTDLNYEDAQQFRRTTQQFVARSRIQVLQHLQHYQQSYFSQYEGYSAVQLIPSQMISDRMQLVQKSIESPKPCPMTVNTEYLYEAIDKISEIQDSLQRVFSKSRLGVWHKQFIDPEQQMFLEPNSQDVICQ